MSTRGSVGIGLMAVALLLGVLLAWRSGKSHPTQVDPGGGAPRASSSGESEPLILDAPDTGARSSSTSRGNSSDAEMATDVGQDSPKHASAEVPEDLKGIELETDPMRVRWRVLRYELQDYQNLAVKDPMGPREGSVVCDSVAAILEATGRGEPPDPKRAQRWNEGEYYILSNGRGYSWSVGEFPEFDAWRFYSRDSGDFAMRRERAGAKGLPFDESPPTFDPINFELIEARAKEAIALLETRYGFKANE